MVIAILQKGNLSGYNLAKVTQPVSDRAVTHTQEFWLRVYSLLVWAFLRGEVGRRVLRQRENDVRVFE